MRPFRTIIAMLFLMLAPVAAWAGELPTAAPESVGMSSAKLKEVDAIMQKEVDDAKIAGGVVIIACRGKVVHFQAYGKADVEADKPMRTDTIVRIYSMSKAIVTAAALTLYDEGKLNLDAPVAQYVPEMKDVKVYTPDGPVPPTRPMTVRDLMRHTSGLVYGFGSGPIDDAYKQVQPLQSKDLDEFAARMGTLPLAYQPGTKWIYSTAIDMLGVVIQRVSGQPLDKFLDERMFTPLDMKDTGFSVPADKLDRFAANYGHDDAGKLKLTDAPATSKYAGKVTLFSGGGGLVSTARDYMRFLMMIQRGGELDGHRILKKGTVGLMTHNQLPDAVPNIGFGQQVRDHIGYGLGFAVCFAKSKFDPDRPVGEFGWGGAASTHYWVSPKDELIVVTLEQRMPYSFETENALKPVIYGAIER
jgi:CubicO group peptidase (beta-lactamase class C family)